jgi:hypothetical protein
VSQVETRYCIDGIDSSARQTDVQITSYAGARVPDVSRQSRLDLRGLVRYRGNRSSILKDLDLVAVCGAERLVTY